jgi:OOP family OmpA-OmpF porin
MFVESLYVCKKIILISTYLVMKKISILTFFAFFTFSVFSQEKNKSKEITTTNYNKLTFEVSVGNAKGLKPYSKNYYSAGSNPIPTSVNSINVGARYMLSPIFGFRSDLGYLDLKNNSKSDSSPFEMVVNTFGLQGVINGSRLFNLENSIGKFGLLIHGGVQLSQMTSKTLSTYYGVKENNVALILGISPQFRLTDKFALISDVSFAQSLRQHLAWDGGAVSPNNNLNGQLISLNFGLSYSFGDENMHGDWANLKYDKTEKINELQDRLYKVERIMDDTASRIINDSYISVDFEAGKLIPSNTSTKNINYIKTYLKENPSVTINIIGHADTTGYNAKNNSIAKARAEEIKSILVKSGIKENRLNIKSPEVFSTVNDNIKSLGKVIFKLN